MIWFKHPNDLPNDKRLAALIDNEGCRGYGMYLRIIEMLCAQPDRKLSFNQLNIISRKGFSRKYMEKIIWEYQLFTIHEEEFESAIDFNHTEKGNHLQNDLKTPEKNEEAKNAHNQLKNRKDSKKTESASHADHFKEQLIFRQAIHLLPPALVGSDAAVAAVLWDDIVVFSFRLFFSILFFSYARGFGFLAEQAF